jgi:uncharacterized protein YcnI
MASSKFTACLAFAAALVVTAAAQAHVTVRPAEAAPAATTTYSVRVPSEGEVATTSVELDIPAGVMVMSVEGALESYELKKTGPLVTSIVWKTAIPAGQRAEFKFSAQNPPNPAEIVWKAHQRFQDGTSADWIEPKGGQRPASITVLKAP